MATQSKRVIFIAESTHSFLWPTSYPFYRLLSGLVVADGSFPKIRLSSVSSAGLTVTSDIAFSGYVDVVSMQTNS